MFLNYHRRAVARDQGNFEAGSALTLGAQAQQFCASSEQPTLRHSVLSWHLLVSRAVPYGKHVFGRTCWKWPSAKFAVTSATFLPLDQKVSIHTGCRLFMNFFPLNFWISDLENYRFTVSKLLLKVFKVRTPILN